jgi:hypothetical protein
MKTSITLALLGSLIAGAARADDVSFSELQRANAICLKNQSVGIGQHPPYHPGYEFCSDLVKKYHEAAQKRDDADEASNPDLHEAKETARKLGILPVLPKPEATP